MTDTGKGCENSLLHNCSAQIREHLQPALKRVTLPLGQILHEGCKPIEYVYFPIDCIVSMLSVLRDGSTAEVSIIGNEGVVGLEVFLGVDSSPARAVVQRGGEAYRLPAKAITNAFCHDRDTVLMLGYTQALMMQMSQTAVCNRYHSIEKRLCRWLLLSLDRLPGNEVTMTQELIANMLGVRREGVTSAARCLQNLGIIEYRRGCIRVLDRAELERRSCECYQVVGQETRRLQTQIAGRLNEQAEPKVNLKSEAVKGSSVGRC